MKIEKIFFKHDAKVTIILFTIPSAAQTIFHVLQRWSNDPAQNRAAQKQSKFLTCKIGFLLLPVHIPKNMVYPLKIIFLSIIFLPVFLFPDRCSAGQPDSLMITMQAELNREMTELKKAPVAPYYIEYRVNESEETGIKSSFGCLTQSLSEKKRILNTRVKIGDYNFDNSHAEGKINTRGMAGFTIPMMLPFENTSDAIKFSLWESTQVNYKMAKEIFTALKSGPADQPGRNDDVADFSKEIPAIFYAPPMEPIESIFNKSEWEEKINKYSKLFLVNRNIISGDVTLQINRERKYFVSTEGGSVVQNQSYCQLVIDGSIRADDGDVLPLYKTWFVLTPAEFPSDDEIIKDVHELISKLEKIRNAPLAEPYTGPAILNARASGVFFHEIFGHRIEGHRMKDQSDGQTFSGKINEQVLPKTMSVIFDPTVLSYGKFSLNGSYLYDDEGIKSRKVEVVEKGILKNFLMSRTPLNGFLNSNGHGRTAAGGTPVSRQSNMFIETSDPVSDADLRRMLIKECKKQKKEYGYMFEDVVGGFTNTGRSSPNAFNIFPTEVYRIYVDGRPDELVRGVDLIGTPLSMFAGIKAAGENKEIFAGICGAESGGVPVTAISPSIFVNRIETQRKAKASLEPTILERPVSTDK
ncbi:MAG: metallopeptidase TldD-related protein [Bacteroidia bacterium]